MMDNIDEKDDIVTYDDTAPKRDHVEIPEDLNRGPIQPTMELRFEERSVIVNNVQSERRKFLQQKFVDLGS